MLCILDWIYPWILFFYLNLCVVLGAIGLALMIGLFGWLFVSYINYKYALKDLFSFTPSTSCVVRIPQLLTMTRFCIFPFWLSGMGLTSTRGWSGDFFLEILPSVIAHRLVSYCMFALMYAMVTLFSYYLGLQCCLASFFLLDACHPCFGFFLLLFGYGVMILGNYNFTQLFHHEVSSRMI